MFGGMVGADAELPFSPMLAELVHRKLHRGEGGIAQTVQAKKRVPRRRTQESFVDGTASVHAELLMPPRVVLSAALSEQVPDRLIFFAAGTHERAVCALSHDGKRGRRKTMHMLCSTNTTVQVSGWIRQRIAIPPMQHRPQHRGAFSCSARTEDASEAWSRGILLFLGREARSLSWT